MLADIKGPHLEFLGGPQQFFTRLWGGPNGATAPGIQSKLGIQRVKLILKCCSKMIFSVVRLQGVSQLLKQSDWAQIQNFK